MRSVEDKGCPNNGGKCRGSHHHHHNRVALGKPAPSKWDDAQKWLVNLSRGAADRTQAPKSSPRNSNADDTRLIGTVPTSDEHDSSTGGAVEVKLETKNVVTGPTYSVVRPICLRDMGTEMTPIASQETSRAATPVRTASPIAPPTPLSSRPDGGQNVGDGKREQLGRDREGADGGPATGDETPKKMSSMEIKALAWEEAERANYTARFKREEVKIQAWENHQRRKAEIENRKVEVKAEREKARAQEKYNSRIAVARRIAEEKLANAEARLQEDAMKACDGADYIRRNGHLPPFSSFNFSFCPWPCCCCSHSC